MSSSKAKVFDITTAPHPTILQPQPDRHSPNYCRHLVRVLRVDDTTPEALVESLPFSLNDVTAGAENEFQTAVVGNAHYVDLPQAIENSNYYKNIIKRTERGDTSRKIADAIRRIITDSHRTAWEHSWVRFPRTVLTPYAERILRHDLKADKGVPKSPCRNDAHKFLVRENGEDFLRIPVSYLLKLSLADAVSLKSPANFHIAEIAERVMKSFANDNTSPEVISFAPARITEKNGLGKSLGRETAFRFLLTQLLVMYANNKFQLTSLDQRVILYSAPHPPVRQKELNDIISDSFYRELFMNPCLSGWDRGQEKYEYMKLCHRVLSRSQLNAVIKLKEAGIITSNLTVVPNVSNICLANNSTHISLGSRKLSEALRNTASGFTDADEKYCGDLAIKIAEHFLPLFVGTYSAAPYRLDFWEFHPEKALGFLPHELDYTHLRMMWRRWKKKADLKVFGQPITPFGPRWLDGIISTVFRLKGDYVPDFRLLDYFASLMSTNESPGLDGALGNGDRLKNDLTELGVFDSNLALYFLYRLRQYSTMGFSGFEGRYYSLFDRFLDDMGEATNLQTLISALAYKYILTGHVVHRQIPDTPTVESERRQIFFGTAVGIPTFFVDAATPNQFMQKILAKTGRTRFSHRYANYVRVYNIEYRRALIAILREDAADLIELYGMEDTINDLERRVTEPDTYAVADRLTRDICREANISSPLQLNGRDFNLAAEGFYRETLRKRHLQEAFICMQEELAILSREATRGKAPYREILNAVMNGLDADVFFACVRKNIREEKASSEVLSKLIQLVLAAVEHLRESNT